METGAKYKRMTTDKKKHRSDCLITTKTLFSFARCNSVFYLTKKAKAVPLQATKVLGWRGGIAPTHSRPRHLMGVSGQRHDPAALCPRGKDLQYPLYRRLGRTQSRSGHRGCRKNSFASTGIEHRSPGRRARHYTD
jgi:hypothetical protein